VCVCVRARVCVCACVVTARVRPCASTTSCLPTSVSVCRSGVEPQGSPPGTAPPSRRRKCVARCLLLRSRFASCELRPGLLPQHSSSTDSSSEQHGRAEPQGSYLCVALCAAQKRMYACTRTHTYRQPLAASRACGWLRVCAWLAYTTHKGRTGVVFPPCQPLARLLLPLLATEDFSYQIKPHENNICVVCVCPPGWLPVSELV
jgi:hypothetical protein